VGNLLIVVVFLVLLVFNVVELTIELGIHFNAGVLLFVIRILLLFFGLFFLLCINMLRTIRVALVLLKLTSFCFSPMILSSSSNFKSSEISLRVTLESGFRQA
jgi:hypothetical protein